MRKKLLLLIAARGRSLSFRSSIPKPLSSFEVSNSVGPLSVQKRGWSYAASVPSETDTLNASKGQKRVSRHERRAMVEAFVNKYREMNAGKFPTASITQKQVGGGYYVVRGIIQELEYNTKMISSNNRDENLVKKEPIDESKLLTTEAVKVSSGSGNTETAKERPGKDDFRLVVSDDKETVNTGYEHLEGKREPQTSSYERRLSKEVEVISRPSNHCIASESNLSGKCSEEPYPSSLQMPNDVKTEEAVSSYSDYVAPESHLLHEEKEYVSSPFGETYGTDYYGKAQGHETKFDDMENCRIMEEKSIEKTGNERREQADLGDLSEEPSHSSLQVPNDVKTGEDVSSHSSDSVAPERHLLKEEIDYVSASFIEKSGSSRSEIQSHDSKFVDMEKHPIIEEKSFEKAGYERKEQLEDLPGGDGQKNKMEQSQGSLELDESKIDNSNNRETSGAVVPVKSTLWGNLKSFADGLINFWRR